MTTYNVTPTKDLKYSRYRLIWRGDDITLVKANSTCSTAFCLKNMSYSIVPPDVNGLYTLMSDENRSGIFYHGDLISCDI